MVRPHKERRIEKLPPFTHYKPVGVPVHDIEEIIITIEEMEAIRLADIERLDQGTAATRMDISRPTFHRIVNLAHQKIATALWQGQALRVDGGKFRIAQQCKIRERHCFCQTCNHRWIIPYVVGQCFHDLPCPSCQNFTVIRDGEY